MVQNKTPSGGQRGSVLLRSGGEVVFETGTLRREWKCAKEPAWGPKGTKRGIGVSEAKMEVPSSVWVVTIRRGGGRGVGLGLDILVDGTRDGGVLDEE